MSRFKFDPRFAAGAAAIAVAAGVLALASVSASATDGSTSDTEPLVVNESGSFYAERQIDAVWAEVTAEWPRKLPSGVAFPIKAPAFFHPEDGRDYIFEQPLPALIAARYWRCAWIEEALAGSGAAERELEQYQGLPGVREMVDVKSYEADFAAYAATERTTPLAAEFDIECGLYTESVEGK